MIGSLRGAVLERTEDSCALIEVSGVGYFVSVTPRTLAELEPGASVFLYVHHHIREDAQTLFGFLHRRLTGGVIKTDLYAAGCLFDLLDFTGHIDLNAAQPLNAEENRYNCGDRK